MRTYETVVVIDSLIKSEEINGIIEKVERIINNNGGNILEIDRWGKKRLAYEIKKRQYGYYVDIYFEAPANLVDILEKEYRLEENILRYLTIHLNSKAIDYHEQQKLRQKKEEDDNLDESENDEKNNSSDADSKGEIEKTETTNSVEEKEHTPVE